MTNDRVSRRAFLAGTTAFAGGLAGCADRLDGGNGDGDGGSDQGGPTTTGGRERAGGAGGQATPTGGLDISDPPALSGWPQRQYDPLNRGHKPNTNAPTGELAARWSQPLARRPTGDRGGGPGVAVADGIIYVANGARTVHAFDTADGTEVWTRQLSVEYENQLLSLNAPAVRDGRVYLTTFERATVIALDAATGETVWETEPIQEAERQADPATIFVDGVPTVVDGTVYVGDDFNNVHAIDAATGEREWLNRDPPKRHPYRRQLAVHDGVVYHGNWAFDAATGDVVWHAGGYTGGIPQGGSPTVYGGHLWKPLSIVLRMIDLRTGEPSTDYGYEVDYRIPGSVCAGGGRLFVAQDNRGGVTGIDLTTDAVGEWTSGPGGPSWRETLPTWNRSLVGAPGLSHPCLVDGTLYLTSIQNSLQLPGYLYGLDAATGETVVEFENPDDEVFVDAPAVVDGTVYLVTFGGTLYALSEA